MRHKVWTWLGHAPLIGAGVTVLIAVAAMIALKTVPPQHSPFAKLNLERPLGAAASVQFARVRENPEQCAAALRASAIEVAPIADTRRGACGFQDAVALTRTHVAWSGPMRVSCPVAAGLYVWEREVVAAAAAAHLESPVVRIETLGTYSCRPIAGRADGRMSEHATANAVDISGFRLENGRLVTVLAGWNGDARDRAFLRAVRDGGCRMFQVVLSPDFNRAHRDHFHFDMGQYDLCR